MSTLTETARVLKITADYGMAGHEEHYVVRCWDGDNPFSPLIECPYEINTALEELVPQHWGYCYRSNRIEIHIFDANRKLASDHVTLRRLVRDACIAVNKKLSDIRTAKESGDVYADMNVSKYFKDTDLFFVGFSIRVSHANYKPNWSDNDTPVGFDLSHKYLELLRANRMLEEWRPLLKSLTDCDLFLRINLKDLPDPDRAKGLKGFLEDSRTKPSHRNQTRTAVLYCSEQERIKYRGIFDNLICSGVKWQERID